MRLTKVFCITKTEDLSQLDLDVDIRKQRISELELRLKDLEEQYFLADFSFYESKYDFQQAQEYKQHLENIRSQQKHMIKAGEASICNREWTVDGDVKKRPKDD